MLGLITTMSPFFTKGLMPPRAWMALRVMAAGLFPFTTARSHMVCVIRFWRGLSFFSDSARAGTDSAFTRGIELNDTAMPRRNSLRDDCDFRLVIYLVIFSKKCFIMYPPHR